jgi:hypothetical protein
VTTFILHTKEWLAPRAKPHPKAYKIILVPVDRRTADDPAKVPAYKGETDWWYKHGKNHRVENGEICRDMRPKKIWVIDIVNTLVFIKEQGFVSFWGPEGNFTRPLLNVEISYDPQ